MTTADVSDKPLGAVGACALPLPGSEIDARLVQGIRAGDRRAEEHLYRRHVRYVGRLLFRLLANRAEAEDATQETFVIALENLGSLRDPYALRGWLAQIAVSQARRRFRRRKILRAIGLDRSFDAASIESIVQSDTAAEVRASLSTLVQLLAQLPIEQRLAWSLRHIEGQTLEEGCHHVQVFAGNGQTSHLPSGHLDPRPIRRGGARMNPKGAELRRALKDPFDKESIERMWRSVVRSRRRDPGPRMRNRFVGGLVLAAAAGVLVILRLPGTQGATALRLHDGVTHRRLSTRDASRTFELSDHSHVELAQGAYLRPEVNTGAVFVVRLDKGGGAVRRRRGRDASLVGCLRARERRCDRHAVHR